jgi:Peptidase MA superfamily
VAEAARFRAWLVATLAVILLGGVVLLSRQPIPAPSTPAPLAQGAPSLDDGRATAVDALLRDRANAVLHHDRTAFLATIDPGGPAAFLTAQRAMFDNLAQMPLSAWSYDLDTTDVATTPSGVAKADELWAPAVELDYALRGVDSAPTSKPMGYLFARHGKSWYLASDTATSHQTWRGPWDFGPVVVLKVASGLVLAHPDNTVLANQVARELDSDVAAVSEVWTQPWPKRVAVLLPDSTAELQALVGPEFAVDSIAAVAISDRVDNSQHLAYGQRVVINPENATQMPASSLRVVLRHEMTHVAARGHTVDGTPMWMLEGFANYVGYRDSGIPMSVGAADVARLVRAGTPPTAPPANGDFAATGDKINLAYAEAWTLTSFIADTFGQQTLVQLYLKIAGGDQIADVDQELKAVLGVDTSGLVAGWQDYLRRQF